ncbi:DNA topoisomerase IB [Gulosibacter molinativorax]|uniref:DNA topoisomerase IB n=1 Tax=Gulosibacter molinativorax TaxID=256821 RepID=UPI000428FE15|nr:DNA topoisomerase IB [Gulosibacter molinativorax]QUY61252.1 DNA topoisomerase I [Gulosibacter molinativorax]
MYVRDGRIITNEREIERIQSLAIPPAWTDVEIARSPRAKVLARGRDAAGRTQRLYRPGFRRQQELAKFERIVRFGQGLPRLRQQVERDLRRRTFSRDKTVACVVRLIDQEFFRVGNLEYAKKHESYGVTTLRRRHVRVTATSVTMEFVGKSGKFHRYVVRDRRLARLIGELRDMPGYEVFRFLDEDGSLRTVRSRDVNEYVKAALGEEFSAKDFRTWGGSVLALTQFLAIDPSEDRAKAVRKAVVAVAERLGNTPAVTQSSYIDPRVIEAFEDGTVDSLRRGMSRMKPRPYLSREEQCLLRLYKRKRGAA